jgi:A/G-specific adenine glycosylase
VADGGRAGRHTAGVSVAASCAPEPAVLAELLLPWYASHARDLPWRRTGTTPWGELVSEYM